MRGDVRSFSKSPPSVLLAVNPQNGFDCQTGASRRSASAITRRRRKESRQGSRVEKRPRRRCRAVSTHTYVYVVYVGWCRRKPRYLGNLVSHCDAHTHTVLCNKKNNSDVHLCDSEKSKHRSNGHWCAPLLLCVAAIAAAAVAARVACRMYACMHKPSSLLQAEL